MNSINTQINNKIYEFDYALEVRAFVLTPIQGLPLSIEFA